MDSLDYSTVDLVSQFDLEFRHDRVSGSDLKKITTKSLNPSLARLYQQSRNWIFDHELLDDMQRYCFLPSSKDSTIQGSSQVISPKYGVGVFSVWQRFVARRDPLTVKQEAWKSGLALRELLGLELEIEENERYYPFIAIRTPAADLSKFCVDHAEHLGRIFTGNYEYEEREWAVQSLRNNISRRSYERLYIRWTEAMGLYDHSIDQQQYELTLFRAVQLFEICIMLRRLLNNVNKNVERISSTLALLPRPWAVQGVLDSVQELKHSFVESPPLWSVEAGRLLKSSFEEFGIPEMIGTTDRGCELMERRLQWAKTQFLVFLGVVTYLLDKLKVFDLIARMTGLTR
jgi:hypothetical protein